MFPKFPAVPLTVVIPVYNREGIVLRTLESLDRQTCRDFRVVLVDNASTDRTREVLEQWGRRTDLEVEIICENRPGAAAARAAGLKICNTEWVMFFDSDDIMLPGHISRALDAVRRHPYADLIGWDIWHTENNRRTLKPFVTSDIRYRSLFNGTMSTLRYFARRSVFESAGNWDPSMIIWDDIEFAARILKLNPVIYKSEGEPTVEVFVQPDSITASQTDVVAVERALGSIARSYGKPHWAALKETILAASTSGSIGNEILRRALAAAGTRSFLFRMAFVYTRSGGRGIARILRPLM